MSNGLLERFLFRKTRKNNPVIDSQVLEIIKSELIDASIVFDIGACHGSYSLAAINIFTAPNIHCFEPFPEAFEILKCNLTGENTTLNNCAISDKTTREIFYVNSLRETNSLLPSNLTNSSIDRLIKTEYNIIVNVETIDNYCRLKCIDEIDLLKIDAQGNTLNILKGSESLLRSNKIKCIQCEVEFLEIYKNQKLYHDIAGYLEQFGYRLFSIYNLHYDVNNRLSWGDAVFFN